jgi:peroxiredoxin Q/BCP
MITVGKKAPAFSLESSEGGQISLASLEGHTVVLYFYPKDATPGCTLEAQQFRDLLGEFEKRGALVLGVSKDSVASHCKFRDKHALGFALLSDPSGEMIEAYGAWGEKVLYGKKSMGILRSTVVVGPDGKVRKHYPKVKADGHAAQVLADLGA